MYKMNERQGKPDARIINQNNYKTYKPDSVILVWSRG
jgi:hypothetical protein